LKKKIRRDKEIIIKRKGRSRVLEEKEKEKDY